MIEATEEAIYNSMFRAKTTTGRGHTVEALPIDRTLEILRKHGALQSERGNVVRPQIILDNSQE